MTDEHAEYAPSSMYLTVACPGWKKQAALLPPEESTGSDRAEGATRDTRWRQPLPWATK